MHTPRAATPTSTFSSSALHCLQSPLLFSFNCSSSSTLLFLPTPPLFFPLPLPSPSPPSALLCLLIFPPFLFPFPALLPPPSLLLLHSPPFHLPFFSPFLFLSPLIPSLLFLLPIPSSTSHPLLLPLLFPLHPSFFLITTPIPSLSLPSIFTSPFPSSLTPLFYPSLHFSLHSQICQISPVSLFLPPLPC